MWISTWNRVGESCTEMRNEDFVGGTLSRSAVQDDEVPEARTSSLQYEDEPYLLEICTICAPRLLHDIYQVPILDGIPKELEGT